MGGLANKFNQIQYEPTDKDVQYCLGVQRFACINRKFAILHPPITMQRGNARAWIFPTPHHKAIETLKAQGGDPSTFGL